ncbi:hypothetical protein I4641_18930 [Waterburya agarophytonicola K14]|uniref:Uncharacterized protein n=1 Tax=Waterburya agarophytonicola KI4 TaxID=2874699 RepID=A0A964BUR9_9CYAN|nr:hypothetical protein [Waterburya agarophytonicola]MCC0179047.1 hypothetical protein [Waterburya agarophytonicola KI4]
MNLAKNNPSAQLNKSSTAANQSVEFIMSNQSQDSIFPNSQTQSVSERKQPIPPPSHPKQYRAIGLIKARYQQSDDRMTQGTLITTDGAEIEAVLLGRIISLIKNHLDLEQEHLWVVYPRTKMKEDRLHAQIVGVWEPETLNQDEELEEDVGEKAEHGYFSIRGEVIFYSTEEETIIIKIKQFPRKKDEKPKFFKLKLKGILGEKPLKRFWDVNVRLDGEDLIIQSATDLGFAQKRKPKFKKDPKKIQLKSSRPSRPSKSATARPIITKKKTD